MTEPVEHGVDVSCSSGRSGGIGAVDHDDGQAQGAGGGDLGIGSRAARVLRHDEVDPVTLQTARGLRPRQTATAIRR